MERNHKKNHLKRKNSKSFPWKLSAETPKEQSSFHFSSSFSLLSLSSFSLFFLSLISYGPRGLNTLLPLVWSTKEALGGIKTPPHLLNRHSFFSIFSNFRSTGTYTSGRPDGQFSSFWKISSRQANSPLLLPYVISNPLNQNFF